MTARMTAIVSDTDPGFRKLRRRLRGQPTFVDVGLFPQDGFEVILKAASNEFGVPEKNIPERSFLRATIDMNRKQIVGFIDLLKNDIVLGTITMTQALDSIGFLVAAKVKKRILSRIPPPNAPITEKLKGFNFPLIETTEMLNTIKHKIGRKL